MFRLQSGGDSGNEMHMAVRRVVGVLCPHPHVLGPRVEEISTPHPVSSNSAGQWPQGRETPGRQATNSLPAGSHLRTAPAAGFEERRKMHDYLMEGLDLVFEKRGLPAIAELLKERRGE